MKKLSLKSIVESWSLEEEDEIKKHLYKSLSPSLVNVVSYLKNLDDDQIRDLGISSKKPIGSGQAGMVFDSDDPNVVVKITPISSDFDAVDYTKDIKHVVPVLDKKRIEGPDGPLFVIKMKRMNPLSDDNKKIIDALKKIWQNKHDLDYQSFDLQRSKQRENLIKKIKPRLERKLSIKNLMVVSELLDMLEDLHGQGVAFNDFKSEQFMSDDEGNLRLVDLGSLKKIK